MTFPYREVHLSGRAAWLRAAVLGANDGLISTSSLMVGVAAASSGRSAILVAGVAGLTAGALSMAAGEYVSVASQRDTERADVERERRELELAPDNELKELTAIYEKRGLSAPLARQVAVELSAGDALTAHARDELGIDLEAFANPVQASLVSALSFIVGAIAALVAGAIGMSIGFVGGYFGGVIDEILSMLTNIVLVIPTLAVLIIAVTFYKYVLPSFQKVLDERTAKIEGGILVRTANGWAFRAAASYDGIGAEDFESYSGSLWVNVPLN